MTHTKPVRTQVIQPPAESTACVPDDFLSIAVSAAGPVGEVLLEQQPCAPHTARHKNRFFDLVTHADGTAEDSIRQAIRRHRPHDAILGEEHGMQGTGRVRWLVDPLDGTTNYINGLAAWAVSIAVEIDGTLIAAAVHAPALGLTYTAIPADGAWCNGKRLACSDTRELRNAVVATGFSASPDHRTVQLGRLAAWLPLVRDVRCHGAAALELCAVASGQLDAYTESHLQVWDVAAGIAIARAAGAAVSGGPGTGLPLIASAPALMRPLADLIGGPHPVPDPEEKDS